jgi:hypothetical protein
MNKKIQLAGRFVVRNLEAFIWINALLYFAFSPVVSETHLTICPLSLAGFEHCPGCGLGRAMILLLHAQLTESFTMHPLAIPALIFLIVRIVVVFKNHFRYQQQIETLNQEAE